MKRGEIRRVQLGDAPDATSDRPALVLGVHEDGGDEYATVMYAHGLVDMATSVDLVLSVLSPSYSPIGGARLKALVVQTDLYSTCSLHQLREVLACVGEHEIDCVRQVFRDERVMSGWHKAGSTMGSTLEEAKADPRWDFKVMQGEWARLAQSDSLRKLLRD